MGGELSLDGAVKPIRGVLPLAIAARDGGFEGVIVPTANAAEAALVDRIHIYPVARLEEAVGHVTGRRPHRALTSEGMGPGERSPTELDMAEVRGQGEIKEALELAAAGGHNVLLCGPPGSGKTMLARRLPGLLPLMSFDEALEVTKIYSVSGLVSGTRPLLTERPFRAPHHTVSDAGLVGGGPLGRPGELSLAHRGVLFLDEFPEFRRNVLEVLRQPLEEGVVHIARANHHVSYPCSVMLVAAMNPCPCGWLAAGERRCTCARFRVLEYHGKVSGPLLDRIDITVLTRRVDGYRLAATARAERPSSWYRGAGGSRPGAAAGTLRRRAPRPVQRPDDSPPGPPPLPDHRAGGGDAAHGDGPLRAVRPGPRPDPQARPHPSRSPGPRRHRGRRRAARGRLPGDGPAGVAPRPPRRQPAGEAVLAHHGDRSSRQEQ